jgi:Carboxypeptidase regulatory-like domain
MIGRRKVSTFAAAVFAILAIPVPAPAQTTTATVTGTVKDPQGAVIPGATVTLISAARGTRTVPAITNATGDFVLANVTADTYSIEVSMSGFKTLKRDGIVAGAGNRVAVGTLTIEVGGMTETVEVKGESPVIQATTGERSFTVTTESVENLPIASRSFTALASLAPGVSGNNRLGGGGANNVMMDGVSTMDTGSNSVLLQMNVESIGEVKVLVSNYQAEYGRSSGLQITAVTKSGTNRFRGSVYDVERNSDWNSIDKTDRLNGDPKTVSKQRDIGYSIGGPIGKPGGSNKLFFFYSHEYAPRTAGNDTQRFRFPTALERQGDFSQTTDNNGNPFPYIRDPRATGNCSTTNANDRAACFADGGVLGKVPASRLYQTGLSILNMYPMPNITNVPAGQNYNYEVVRPNQSLLAWQPAIRLDYNVAASLRTTFKYSGWAQRKETINGSLPGFNDTLMHRPVVSTWTVTANYSLTPTMFLEATYGQSLNELTGCGVAQNGTGPTDCRSAFPVNPMADRIQAGLGGLPYLFPDAVKIQERYYAYEVLEGVPQTPIWQNGRIVMPPNFNFGNRVSNAPPNIPFPGFLNINATKDIAVSMTKIAGRHTIKMGFYNTHSYKAQQRGGWNGTINFSNDGNNPLDSQFGYANAALGIFSNYQQASAYVEGAFVYDNTEGYIQDNWKVNEKLTLDYGVRLVRQQPQYDSRGQASNFFVDKWSLGEAPLLYTAGCSNGAVTCSGNTRQAMDPRNGQLLGPNSTLAIGGIVPGTGSATNGLFLSGQGIVDTTYKWPLLALAPRFGMAYDMSGNQTFVLRGGAGLFYDRPSGNSIYSQVQNPPVYKSVTVRYGELQTLGQGGLTTEGPPALSVFEYDGGLPSSTQWNGGVQMMLPWNTSLDVEYVGQHSFQTLQGVGINAVDFGAAFLQANQDPTLGTSATPGATAVSQDRMRAYRGYAGIDQQLGRGMRTYHSLQLSFQRRFSNGFSFGFNDTIGLYDRQNSNARIQHNADGTWSYRADQAEADELLGNNNPVAHTMKANFVWDLPDLKGDSGAMRAIGLVVNDWQLSGIWTAATASAYTVGFSYQNGGGSVNLTGSPDYGARVRVVGDVGAGCSSDPYRQFSPSGFQGPLYNSVGLESGNDYLRGCFSQVLDLAIARNIRLGGTRNLQLRVDMFNAPNAAGITARNTNINLTNPNDPVTITNLPFNPDGSLITSRSLPRGAGVGVATDYQNARTIQVQVRFSF